MTLGLSYEITLYPALIAVLYRSLLVMDVE